MFGGIIRYKYELRIINQLEILIPKNETVQSTISLEICKIKI